MSIATINWEYEKPNATALIGFAAGILNDVGERRDAEGTKFSRGKHRIVRDSGKEWRPCISGRYLSFGGQEKFRGNDFGIRVAMAVAALQEAEYLNWDACVEIADFEAVKSRIGKLPQRRPKGRKVQVESLVGRAENVRSKANRHIRTNPFFHQEFQLCFGYYWRIYGKDDQYVSIAVQPYKRKVEDLRRNSGTHPMLASSLCNLARVLEEHGRFTEAKTCYREALALLQGNAELSKKFHPSIVGEESVIRQAIERCRRGQSQAESAKETSK